MSPPNLNVTLVQAELSWEQPELNRERFSQRLTHLSQPTDLVILPEMFTTGFSMAPERTAEPAEGPSLQWMQTQARRLNAVITGSLAVRDKEGHFNRLYWVRPDGSFEHYDKRHLFTLAGEQYHYQAGTERLVVELKGWRVMPLICYDLRFPVWSRNDLAYDLLLYVANFPARRRLAWNTLLPARAVENQAYIIGVNRVGADGKQVDHAGDSSLYDFEGNLLFQATNVENINTIALSYKKLEEFRSRFRFLDDRDTFELKP